MASDPGKTSHKRSRHASPRKRSRERLSAPAPGGHVAHGKRGGNMRWWGGMKEMDYPHAKAFADAETHLHARCVDVGGYVPASSRRQGRWLGGGGGGGLCLI